MAFAKTSENWIEPEPAKKKQKKKPNQASANNAVLAQAIQDMVNRSSAAAPDARAVETMRKMQEENLSRFNRGKAGGNALGSYDRLRGITPEEREQYDIGGEQPRTKRYADPRRKQMADYAKNMTQSIGTPVGAILQAMYLTYLMRSNQR